MGKGCMYAIVGILAVSMLSVWASAGYGDSSDNPWRLTRSYYEYLCSKDIVSSSLPGIVSDHETVVIPGVVASGGSHYLQNIYKNDAGVSVDTDNDGFFDSADNCNGSSPCEVVGSVAANGNIRLGGAGPTYKITNIQEPTAVSDVATKSYIDRKAGYVD